MATVGGAAACLDGWRKEKETAKMPRRPSNSAKQARQANVVERVLVTAAETDVSKRVPLEHYLILDFIRTAIHQNQSKVVMRAALARIARRHWTQARIQGQGPGALLTGNQSPPKWPTIAC